VNAPPHAARGAEHDDAALVHTVLGGERDAFCTLVKRHQASLFRYAHSLGTPPEIAEDLVQDAFVRAYERLRQCRDGARFRSWLLSIFRNLIMDHARSRTRDEVPLDAVEHTAAAPAPAPELRGAVAQALEALPELLREAFLLRHHHGYSYDEIAAITASKTSAVKMRVHRAREQLRAALDDEAVRA
jgi:RNA polymerase sigma-70 factor, ECF subfamily